jgi:hypothetical protein
MVGVEQQTTLSRFSLGPVDVIVEAAPKSRTAKIAKIAHCSQTLY